jgi:hypothetical protein
MSIGKKLHRDWVSFQSLPRDQGGHDRHRCAGCTYEKGYYQGVVRGESMILDLDSLDESQASIIRHKSPHSAFARGYQDVVHASYKH